MFLITQHVFGPTECCILFYGKQIHTLLFSGFCQPEPQIVFCCMFNKKLRNVVLLLFVIVCLQKEQQIVCVLHVKQQQHDNM